MNNTQFRGTPFQGTGTGVATITVTISKFGQNIYVTDIHCSGDNASGTIIIQDNTTTIWQGRMGSSGWLDSDFITPLRATTGTVNLTATGTTVVFANIQGYSL